MTPCFDENTAFRFEDLVLHLNQVRQLRDDLLGMDFTKEHGKG